MKPLYVFVESAHVSPVTILEENTSLSFPKIKYRTILQTLNEKNNNARFYDDSIGDQIVQKLAPMAESRGLIGEFDHPFVPESSDPKTMQSVKRRMLRYELKSACNLYTKIWRDGNLILGEAETLTFSKGPDLYKAIMIDRVDIGHSLRAIGGLQPTPEGYLKVVPPFVPVTYDVVINPSHSKAKVLEVTTEEAIHLIDDDGNTRLITEDYEAVLDDEKITICTENKCFQVFKEEILEEILRIVVPGLKIL